MRESKIKAENIGNMNQCDWTFRALYEVCGNNEFYDFEKQDAALAVFETSKAPNKAAYRLCTGYSKSIHATKENIEKIFRCMYENAYLDMDTLKDKLLECSFKYPQERTALKHFLAGDRWKEILTSKKAQFGMYEMLKEIVDKGYQIKEINIAGHAMGKWIGPGKRKDLLLGIAKNKTVIKVLLNKGENMQTMVESMQPKTLEERVSMDNLENNLKKWETIASSEKYKSISLKSISSVPLFHSVLIVYYSDESGKNQTEALITDYLYGQERTEETPRRHLKGDEVAPFGKEFRYLFSDKVH